MGREFTLQGRRKEGRKGRREKEGRKGRRKGMRKISNEEGGKEVRTNEEKGYTVSLDMGRKHNGRKLGGGANKALLISHDSHILVKGIIAFQGSPQEAHRSTCTSYAQ